MPRHGAIEDRRPKSLFSTGEKDWHWRAGKHGERRGHPGPSYQLTSHTLTLGWADRLINTCFCLPLPTTHTHMHARAHTQLNPFPQRADFWPIVSILSGWRHEGDGKCTEAISGLATLSWVGNGETRSLGCYV